MTNDEKYIDIETLNVQAIYLTFLQFYLSNTEQYFQVEIFLHITQIKGKILKTIHLRHTIASLKTLVRNNKKKWIQKQTLLIGSTILFSYILPTRFSGIIVHASDKLPWDKVKKTATSFFFETENNGTKRFNFKNILITGVTVTAGAMLILLWNDTNFSRIIFKPKLEVFSKLSPVAFTLLEREELQQILQEAANEVKIRNLTLDAIKLTYPYKKIINGNTSISGKNVHRIMRALVRVFFNSIDTGKVISYYKNLSEQEEFFNPYLEKILSKEIFPQLEISKQTFYKIFKEFLVKTDPTLSSSIRGYFSKNLDYFFNIEDLKSNDIIFNKTVEDLVNLFNQQNKN